MEAFKVEHFERERGPATFPHFRSLSGSEADNLKRSVALRLGLPADLSPLEVVTQIEERSQVIAGADAEDIAFDLGNLLREIGIVASGLVFLNWRRFDDVDEMLAADVLNFFDDLWYPSADDIDLVDPGLNWIISVHHSGKVSVLQLGGS